MPTHCLRLGRLHRSDDHRNAAEQLRQATPDGLELAAALLGLPGRKDTAHYGLMVVAARKARDAVRWSVHLKARPQSTLDLYSRLYVNPR